jgi:hypothetical protein
MTDRDRARSAIALLDEVIRGQTDAHSALRRWPDIDSEESQVLKDAWHELSHFAADHDIHARDPDYRQAQLEALKACIDRIARDVARR